MKKVASIVLTAALSVALPASALTVQTEGSASGSANASSGVNVNITSETNVNSKTTSSSDTSANAQTEENTQFEVDATGPIIIRASLLGDDVIVNVHSSAEVKSKADLNAYASGVVKTSADIRDVEMSESEVSVSHRERARLFGFLPISVFARATVGSDGTVQVKYPWYCWGAQKAALESKVATAVKTSIPARASAEGSVKFSAQAQAQVFEKIAAAMKSHLEAEANAKVDSNIKFKAN